MTIISLPVNKMASITTVPNGATLVSNGTGYTYHTNTTSPWDQVMTVNSPNERDPTLTVTGKMVINGVDLEERLSTIEKVLQIPERDVILEKKHPKLKKLYNEYVTALAKYRTFEAIKGEDDVA